MSEIRSNDLKVVIGNRVMLAPLAGVADSAYRAVCRLYGAGPFISEMVSAHGVAVGREPLVAEQMALREFQRPLTLQLVGNSPEMMVKGALSALSMQADAINLNMACPARKIVGSGKGCALMRDLGLAREVMQAVREAVSVPLTLKIRAGWSSESINAVEFAQAAEESGFCAVIVHGRTGVQGFTGRADWSVIGDVKRSVGIAVVGNGDVKSGADAVRLVEQTGCDAVMIGRGSYGRPWIFSEVLGALRGSGLYPEEELEAPEVSWARLAELGVDDVPSVESLEGRDPEAVGRLVLIHSLFSAAFKPEFVVCREVRKHLLWYTKGMPHSSVLRATMPKLESLEAIRQLVSELPRLTSGKYGGQE